MAKHEIKSLKFLNFLKLQPKRQEMINNAADSFVRPVHEYKANETAALLHPQAQQLIVSKVISETTDVRSYILKAERAAYFKAGQYLSISFDIGQSHITRPYSISSSPSRSLSGEYMITVRRTEGGFASQYIFDNWKEGTAVNASMPLGNFTYNRLRDAKTVIAIAGGSGITPFYSMAQAIRDKDEDFNLTILYGTRTMNDAIFEAELVRIAKECSKVRLINILSEEKDPQNGAETGFITARLIQKYAPDSEDYSIFLCGPQAMYRFADTQISELGIKRKFVRRELFGKYEKEGPDTVFCLTVLQAGQRYDISCRADESLLISMEKAGIKAPSRCRSGECGWCRSRLISGQVDIPEEADFRRMADIRFPHIHPCVSFPCSDIVLEVPPFKA